MNCDSKLELPEKILLSTKKQAQNESLLILRNYNNELADEHKKKEEYLRTLKHEKSEKECKIKSLLCSIGIKHQEIQKEKHESEFDCTIENDWKKRVELIQKKRITSLQEYQNKMAEFRKELFSSISFNDDVITQEINDIEHKQEILQSNIHNVEIILQEMEKTLFILDTEIEIEKENTNLLIENLENAKYSNEIELQKLGKEILIIDK